MAWLALVATVLFDLGKRGFVLYLTNFPSYQRIYGAFAAVPIFLIWVYLSWNIVLLGALLASVLSSFRYHPEERKLPAGHEFAALLRTLSALAVAHADGGLWPRTAAGDLSWGRRPAASSKRLFLYSCCLVQPDGEVCRPGRHDRIHGDVAVVPYPDPLLLRDQNRISRGEDVGFGLVVDLEIAVQRRQDNVGSAVLVGWHLAACGYRDPHHPDVAAFLLVAEHHADGGSLLTWSLVGGAIVLASDQHA